MKEIYLVLCGYNVARSQMGAGFLRALTSGIPEVEIYSAGIRIDKISLMKKKYGNRPHPDVCKVMLEEGYDIQGETIDPINISLMQKATTIVVLDEDPPYADKFEKKLVRIPIADPVKEITRDIPEVSLRELRILRNQIYEGMFKIFMKDPEFSPRERNFERRI